MTEKLVKTKEFVEAEKLVDELMYYNSTVSKISMFIIANIVNVAIVILDRIFHPSQPYSTSITLFIILFICYLLVETIAPKLKM